MKQKNFNETKKMLLKLILSVFLLIPAGVSAQVTIGSGKIPETYSVLELISNSTMGMRLPQMTTAERNAMQATFGAGATAEAKGLVIYNTTNDCVEYWNDTRWISLCEGNSQMTISPQPCQAVAADGTGCDEEFSITDPDCENGPFSFAVVAGADYAFLADVDEANGTFRINFLPNNSIQMHSIIVRVTSICTNLYRDFLFTQEGQSCNLSLGLPPDITAVPSGKNIAICEGGAVYLMIPAGTPNMEEVIWTRNNLEIARGVSAITVTQPGSYDVWMGFIGCVQIPGNTVTVTKDGTGAPDPIAILTVGNNGLVCGPSGTTTLIAQKPSTGTVRWFKDGVPQPLTTPDNIINNAGVGIWTAVVNSSDGSCWSKPSAQANVMVDPGGTTPITMPVIESNGAFCAGGSVYLSVSSASYNSAYTYIWYENNTQIGTGPNIVYNVPTGVNSVVIRCRATQSGSCAAEAIGERAITMGTVPARPVITGNTVLFSGMATLNVIPAGGGTYSYTWYKDNQPIGTAQSIVITSGGNYYASVTEVGGCASPLAYRNIPDITSATPTVTLNRSNENPALNDIVTYDASINFGPATAYNWIITNATLQSGGGNTSHAVVKFDHTGAASVSVEVSNACGTGSTTHSIANVATACADPVSVFPNTDATINMVTGQAQTLGAISASFANGATPTAKYQWYENTVKSNTGGTAIAGATGNTYIASKTAAGTYYFYCEVSNAGCSSTAMASGVYELIVSLNPENMTLGAGTFTGITCFDINKSNFATNCGTEAARAASATNFATLGAVTYTFTASSSGTKSNLRFMVIDTEGVISTWTGNNIPGTIANNQTSTLIINYRTDLSNVNGMIYGRTRDYAAKVKLYAVYNNGVQDVAVPLIVNIQDCICCPGYLSVKGEYVQKTTGYLATTGGDDFASLAAFFTATGKDVCFFKTNGGVGGRATWANSKANCSNGNYVDAEYRPMGGWRLPTIAELGFINNIALANHPASAPGTVDMYTDTYYWSITEINASSSWSWTYVSSVGIRSAKTGERNVRCVKSF